MNDTVLLVLRLALGAVFLVAAGSKALQLEAFRESLKEFGVRNAELAKPVAVAVPVLEAALAVGLLMAATAWVAAIGALALLAVFTAGIVVNLAKGRRPACNCFGQLRSKPIGKSTVVRNLLFAAVAAILAAQGAERLEQPIPSSIALSTGEWLLAAWCLVTAAVIVWQTWLVVQLMRQQGRLMVRLDTLETTLGNVGVVAATEEPAKELGGLQPGTLAPVFAGRRVDGQEVTLSQLRQRGAAIMLLFSDPNCGPCNALLPQLAKWQEELAGRAEIVVVSNGPVADIRAKFAGMDRLLANVVVQQESAIAAQFLVRATPSAVLVNALGLVDSYIAIGSIDIAALVPLLAASAVRERETKNMIKEEKKI